jgi:hypothetical protein
MHLVGRTIIASALLLGTGTHALAVENLGVSVALHQPPGGTYDCLVTFENAVPSRYRMREILNYAMNFCISADDTQDIMATATTGNLAVVLGGFLLFDHVSRTTRFVTNGEELKNVESLK